MHGIDRVSIWVRRALARDSEMSVAAERMSCAGIPVVTTTVHLHLATHASTCGEPNIRSTLYAWPIGTNNLVQGWPSS
jgi:hypothetical protein